LPEEAKNHVGENASVRGLVEQVSISKKGHAFLNFGGRYPNQIFTGFVPAEHVSAVGGEKFLQSLADNPVTITGKIELYTSRRSLFVAISDRQRVSKLRRGGPQKPDDGKTNQLVAKVSRLYAEALPDDQFALRVWMRDMILGRKVGNTNMVHARRIERRMVEACKRRILEFPLGMDAREVAKELKREGWYAWASDYRNIILRIERVRATAGGGT
jgi:hypothetical protein